MGSKNLKAVVVRGTGAVKAGDAAAFTRDLLALQEERILTADNAWTWEEGTPYLVDLVNAAGALPTRNWRSGQFEDAAASSRRSCRTCAPRSAPAPSARSPAGRSTGSATTSAKGRSSRRSASAAPTAASATWPTIAAFNGACDELGLDTMSTGAVVALAMDLCEKGAADYGLAFGDAAGYLAAPGLIARREGWGAELALGTRDLAALKGRPDLAPHIKGLELPAYDPRGTFGMGLGYATSDRGACHMRAFTAADDILGGEAPADSLEGKPALTVEQQDFSALAWTGVWCANMYVDTDFLGVHFRHLWGRETSHEELMTIGARIWNLGRLLNLREGFTRAARPAAGDPRRAAP